MLDTLQPVESSAFVNRAVYLLSDIKRLRSAPTLGPEDFHSQPWKGPFMPQPLPAESQGQAVSDFVTETPKTAPGMVQAVHSPIPLVWILDPGKSATFVNRVLARLIQAEAHEPNPHFRDDYRQTFITLSFWTNGEFQSFQDAFVATSYQMYGVHPEQLWGRIVLHRQALLGQSNLTRFPKKKFPAQSVTDAQKAGVA